MKQLLWKLLGFLSLGLAYLGIITPGLPWSCFVVFAAYCFAKSSPRMHTWIYGHPKFGPFLTNWTEKKVFPRKMKYLMIVTMSTTGIFLLLTAPLKGVILSAVFMFLVAVWAWRYPDTVEEYTKRKTNGEKIGWLK
jgi:uncharacterized membrane protein YbaN (DUF454 family)